MGIAGALQVFWRLGLREAIARPRRSLLTVAGVAAGVALTFATTTIDTTLQTSIATTIRGTAGDAQLEVSAPPNVAGIGPALVRRVARTPGVAAAFPLRRTTAQLESTSGTERVLVLGVPRHLGRLFDGGLGSAGRQVAALRGRRLLLGEAVLPASPTSELRALRMETPAGYRRLPPASRLAAVPFGDLNGGAFALMNVDAADSLFTRQGLVDSIYVSAKPGFALSALRGDLERRVAGRAFVGRPGSQSQPYERAFQSLSQLTQLAVAGSLWVALFVVFNSMSLSLLERRRSISLAFALGAGRAQIATALLIEAALLGAVAAVIGGAGGFALAQLLIDRSLEAYPLLPITASRSLQVTPETVALALASGPLIAVLGTLVPARRILGVAPTESLRVESAYEWSGARKHVSGGTARSALGGGAFLAAGIVAAALGATADAPTWVGGLAMVLILTGGLLLLPVVLSASLRGLHWLLARAFGVVGRLAGGSLLRSAGRTTVTVGVLSLTAATALGLGTALGSFESQMQSTFTDRYGAPLYVTANSYTGITSDQPMPRRVGTALQKVDGVEAVYPLRYRPANIEGDQALIASAPLSRQTRDGVRTALVDTTAGSRSKLMSGLQRGGIVPSRFTADRHDLAIGQTLRIPGPDGERGLPVVGIFDDVLSVDSVYMERETYVRLSGDSTVDHFAIAPMADTSVDTLAARLDRSIADQGINASVQTRDEVIDDILTNVRGMFAIVRGLQIAALLIAGLVVANTMFTVVAERRWELSLGRMLGMTRSQVTGSVLLEALGVGLVGAVGAMLAGVAVGFLMLTTMEARFSWTIDFQLQWELMGTIIAIGIVGALAASLVPARSAARAPIVESLRSE